MPSLRKNLFYSAIVSLTQVASPLLTIPYIARILEPQGVGRVSFLDGFTFYFVILAEAGVMVHGIREVSKVRDDSVLLGKLVSELLVIRLVTALLILFPFLASMYLSWDKIEEPAMLITAVGFFMFNAISTDWFFVGLERFDFIAFRNIIVRILGIVAIFLLITDPAHYFIYYMIIAGTSMITNLWNFGVVVSNIKLSFRNLQLKRHARFLWITYSINLVYSIPLMLDNVLLRFVNTSAVVAIYALPAKMIRLGTTMITDSLLVLFPRIVFQNAKLNSQEAHRSLGISLQIITLVAIPFGTGVFLLSNHVATILFGNRFVESAVCLRILSVYPILKCLGLFLSNSILLTHNREYLFLKNLVVATICFLIIALTISTSYGAAGMCIAIILFEVILLCLNFFTIRANFPHLLTYRLNFVPQAFLGTLFMGLSIMGLQLVGMTGLALVILSTLGGMTIYVGTLLLIKNEVAILVLQGAAKFFTGLINVKK